MKRSTPLVTFMSLVLIAIFVGGLLLGGASQGSGKDHSAFSTEAGGRRVAYQLLGQLGFDRRAWTSEPGRLGGEEGAAGTILLMAKVPPEPLVQGTRIEGELVDGPRGRGLRDQRHYLRYLEEGGSILFHASPELLEFFGTTLDVGAVSELREASDAAEFYEEAVEVLSATGETLALPWPLWPPPDAALSADANWELALADVRERPVALSINVGRGRLLLLSPEDDPLRNEALSQDDAALALVRLVEFLAPSGPVYFDEYALGLWAPESPLELALAPERWLFTGHVLLLGLILLWRAAWVGPFPRDPEVFESVSPVARARGFSGLLLRRRRYDVLAELLRQGILRRLARRAGLRGEEVEFRGPPPREAVDRVLAVLLPVARAGRSTHDQASSLFLEAPPEDAEGFEQLGRDLARLERRLIDHAFESGERTQAR